MSREGSWASSPSKRRNMQANRSRDTLPELALRRELHRRGRRYRVHVRPLPTLRRSADIVFARRRVAVFVDGCFWHQCPEHATTAQTNADFWAEKLAKNVARDHDTNDRLVAAGWTVIRVWEHESTTDAADRIESVLAT
ncbi:MAG: very short patch repair endonuclease [Nocardioides sp.]